MARDRAKVDDRAGQEGDRKEKNGQGDRGRPRKIVESREGAVDGRGLS